MFFSGPSRAKTRHSVPLQGKQSGESFGAVTLFASVHRTSSNWNVATRPVNVNGLGLGVSETKRTITRCETLFRLLPETPEIFQEWKRLVVVHEVSGLKVHDARLVAAMNVHQVSSIITFDTGDFQRYVPGIEVIHPKAVAV